MKTLDFLELSKDFTVNKEENSYKVSHNQDDLVAYITNKSVEYFVSGCYNSGCDLQEININAFRRLVKFCELIIKMEEEANG
jgi:hypothetical protein